MSTADHHHQADQAHHQTDAHSRASGLPAASDQYAESVAALDAANARMHEAMALAPSGDVDVDFAAGMLAHHEGAIEMARVELRYGGDPELRRLAEAIVAGQEPEIAMMRAWLAKHRR